MERVEERGTATAGTGRRPNARALVKRTLLQSTALAGLAGFVTLLCVNALARGGVAAERSVTGLLLAILTIQMVAVLVLHAGFFRDVIALDTLEGSEAPDRSVLERGFARIVNGPRYWFVRSFGWFVLGAVNLSVARHLLEPEAFPLAQVVVRSVGSMAGAFLFAALLFFLLKRQFAPLRVALAAEFEDVEAARRCVQPLRLRTKVIVGVTGGLVVATLYGAVLAQVRSDRTAETTAAYFGRGLIDDVAAGADAERVAAEGRRRGLLEQLLLADPASDPALASLVGPLAEFEVRRIRERPASGDSLEIDSPRHFAWRTLPDGRIAVAVSSADRFGAHVPSMSGALGVFLGLVLLVTVAVAWLLAADTERAVRELSEEVGRLASGDLQRGLPLVWEDELGDLAGRLDHMAASLGAMIVRVRGTADRVEGAAGGIAEASARLLDTSREQVKGSEAMRRSLTAVTGQVGGIAGSAGELTSSVEEGSSSIVELRSSGQHLDDNAALLHDKVDEVSSSVGELIRSVRNVLEHVEQLSGASVDTSSSMEQMAASLREVDANALETAKLSEAVVAQAEQGADKVRETLQGMEGIRETTQAARGVIRGLGDRTKEIGTIVNVIDDVAGETNLLALNAAIIAAQAGENGRSFSVVADEIKKLADRVLASTQEIERVIHAVQEETANAVGAIEEGSRVVALGVSRAHEAGEALDVITASARDSGVRIREIVTAVNEQSRASGHVVSLMERVRVGVEQIRRAGEEQDRGNETMLAGTEVMREISQRVSSTTGEQAQGSARIAEGIEAVREAVRRINESLSEQTGACTTAEHELEQMEERSRAHGQVAQELDEAVGRMRGDADRLRDAVGRFRV